MLEEMTQRGGEGHAVEGIELRNSHGMVGHKKLKKRKTKKCRAVVFAIFVPFVAIPQLNCS